MCTHDPTAKATESILVKMTISDPWKFFLPFFSFPSYQNCLCLEKSKHPIKIVYIQCIPVSKNTRSHCSCSTYLSIFAKSCSTTHCFFANKQSKTKIKKHNLQAPWKAKLVMSRFLLITYLPFSHRWLRHKCSIRP